MGYTYKVKSPTEFVIVNVYGQDSYIFATEERAKRYCEAWSEWVKVRPTLPSTLTGGEYAEVCAKHGVEPISPNSYAVQYGEFDPETHGVKKMIQMSLASTRRSTMIKEAKAAREALPPPPPAKPVETFVCSGCGETFPMSQAMNASLGMTCPDCYDSQS